MEYNLESATTPMTNTGREPNFTDALTRMDELLIRLKELENSTAHIHNMVLGKKGIAIKDNGAAKELLVSGILPSIMKRITNAEYAVSQIETNLKWVLEVIPNSDGAVSNE